jgi:hypothetical protein
MNTGFGALQQDSMMGAPHRFCQGGAPSQALRHQVPQKSHKKSMFFDRDQTYISRTGSACRASGYRSVNTKKPTTAEIFNRYFGYVAGQEFSALHDSIRC